MRKKVTLVSAALLLLVSAVNVQGTVPVEALSLDEQINAVQREIDQYRAKSEQLKDEAASIEKELAGLSAQKQTIEGQIALTQLQHDKLQQEIAVTQKKIDGNRSVLGTILADIYVDDQISPLEMLASSKNISDFVDKRSHRSAISQNLASTVQQINKLKETLASQQNETERLLGEQKLAKQALADKEVEQQNLLAKTQGDNVAYQTLTADREARKGELHKQQQAAIEAAMRRGGSGFNPSTVGDASKGGYPWEAGCTVNANAWSFGGPNGNGTDPLGYGCRQCVSYTAFKVGQRTGNYPRYWGNANMWPASARASGYQTGSTPRANSVGVIMSGQYGHTVWVDSVNADGTLTISQYNYFNAGGPGWGHYSKMRVSAATYDVYIYF